MKLNIKWSRDNDVISFNEMNTTIDGFKVDRVAWSSGTKRYYVHYIEYPHYAAVHWCMSDSLKSLNAVRRFIEQLKKNPNACTVAELKRIKAEKNGAK